ncbi:MarR family winged helix-turn-helix transcriptional regulator [Ramlibacter sp.]|uniref:MarR family winged helix-turn-helix transcriptional regulator n=1 Tax=Ramlibacter sp. TaxID=1917967 RepID=UPI0035AE953F
MTARHRILQDRTIPFAYRISFLANFFTGSVYRQVLARHDVARSEFVLLYCLHRLGELTAQQVCDITGRPKNSVSRAVNAMLERGHVVRDTDPADARRGLLKLTRQGRELVDAALPLFREREAAMLAPLNARERDTLDRLLAKLVLRDDPWADVADDGD